MTEPFEQLFAHPAEIDQGPVHGVGRPYAGLSNAAQLRELTTQYWAAAEEDNWGDKLDAFRPGPTPDATRASYAARLSGVLL